MDNEIKLILDGLARRRESSGGVLEIQGSDGVVNSANFELSPPATLQDIRMLESQYQIKLPREYKSFLTIHNGAKLFDIGYGEFTKIFSIEEVDEIAATMMPEIVPQFLPIARNPSSLIYIDLSRKTKYMFTESISEFNFLSMSFTEWINALIMANGCSFWDWTPLMVYRTIDEPELKVKDWLLAGFE
ncbi:SMI1/KNR4 family protein [Paenibacillus sp. SN-8-1]|uniref:SMI1/KNR4 family protein n=1 Tax=Paenibacillus sp. SN-8-1 TaxID=3435409 RepID=UPI003D9A9535